MAETPCGPVHKSPVRSDPHAPKQKTTKTWFGESGPRRGLLSARHRFEIRSLGKHLFTSPTLLRLSWCRCIANFGPSVGYTLQGENSSRPLMELKT